MDHSQEWKPTGMDDGKLHRFENKMTQTNPGRLNTQQRALLPKLSAANINPDSFFATDYLNHYNEIVMLMEMLPDMPDMLEEALEWKPKSYPDHFSESQFQAKDLAVEAFYAAPTQAREALDAVCSLLDKAIMQTMHGLKIVAADSRGLSESAKQLLQGRITDIQTLLMKLNQVIHGKHGAAFIEDLFKVGSPTEAPADKSDGGEAQSQADIDKLFD